MLNSSRLACMALHHDSYGKRGAAMHFWSATLPQLGQSEELVFSAMAVLGNALEPYHEKGTAELACTMRQYGFALQLVQKAINSEMTSMVPLVAACLLLALTDILTGREQAALSHLQGSLALLQRRQQGQQARKGLRKIRTVSDRDIQDAEGNFVLEDEMDAAGAILDVSTASYALGLPPRLPKLLVTNTDTLRSRHQDFAIVEHRTVENLHASYNFASRYFQWKYVAARYVPSEAFVDQTKHIIKLSQCIEDLHLVLDKYSDRPDVLRANALMAQCLSCKIYLSALLNPYETAYDSFNSSFRSIVTNAKEFVSQGKCARVLAIPQISLDLGIVQPLFFTAVKCRDSQIRKEAVEMLRRAGREGPFDGKRHAIVAQRAIVIEESTLSFNQGANDLHAKVVPERSRLHGAGPDANQSIPPKTSTQGLLAWFSICKDVELMVDATSPEAYRDERYWVSWHEFIED